MHNIPTKDIFKYEKNIQYNGTFKEYNQDQFKNYPYVELYIPESHTTSFQSILDRAVNIGHFV